MRKSPPPRRRFDADIHGGHPVRGALFRHVGSLRQRPASAGGGATARNGLVGEPIHRFDVRLQKRVTTGTRALVVFVDAYNLANMGNEVEERVVTGGLTFRDITAIQPPLAVHIGVRVQF